MLTAAPVSMFASPAAYQSVLAGQAYKAGAVSFSTKTNP